MKILFISPDFNGHYLSIFELYNFIKSSFPFVDCIITKLDNSNNSTTDPMQFVLDNAQKDVDYLSRQIDFVNVGLIVYDFFAIAGLIIGKKLNIPTVCSIPAIMSNRFNIRDNYYQQCYEKYEGKIKKLGLDMPDLLSDGWLFSSKDNIVWTYKGLMPIIPEKKEYNFHFVGSKSQFAETKIIDKDNLVYMSLGTVVPNSLYNIVGSKSDKIKEYIINVYETVINYFGKFLPNYELIVSCPLDIKSKYKNVKVVKYCNQDEILAKAKLFITHGGGNSVNEAILYNCPMLVIPFFGDQFVSARYIVTQNIGLSLGDNINDFGHSTNELLNSGLNGFSKLLLSEKLEYMLNNLSKFSLRIELVKSYDEKANNLKKIKACIGKYIDFKRLWKPYDLLYGTTADRLRFVDHWKMSDLFKIGVIGEKGNYITVDQLNIVPCLIDQWNDLLRQYTIIEINGLGLLPKILDSAINYRKYLLEHKIVTESQIGSDTLITKTQDQREIINGVQLIDMCCAGIDYYLQNGSTIHFVIDKFNPNDNPGTNKELSYILSGRPNVNVIFWKRSGDNYFPIAPKIMCSIRNNIIELETLIGIATNEFDALKALIDKNISKYKIWLQGRIKTLESACRKMEGRNIQFVQSIDDIIGFRIIYPWSTKLVEIANILEADKTLQIFKRRVTERGKVIYLYGKYCGLTYEIQLWPTIMYHCFEEEHEVIYKGKNITNNVIEASLKLRDDEHRLQNIIDSNKLL
jgi:hypothetical protein